MQEKEKNTNHLLPNSSDIVRVLAGLEPVRVTQPIKREYPKWGRNWPCFCGSGLKFKKCCLLCQD